MAEKYYKNWGEKISCWPNSDKFESNDAEIKQMDWIK